MHVLVPGKNVFSAALNLSSLSIGSRRLSGREFQVIGPTTETRSTKLLYVGPAVSTRMGERSGLQLPVRGKIISVYNQPTRLTQRGHPPWIDNQGPYLNALAMGSSHKMALYKCPITPTTLADSLRPTQPSIPADGLLSEYHLGCGSFIS